MLSYVPHPIDSCPLAHGESMVQQEVALRHRGKASGFSFCFVFRESTKTRRFSDVFGWGSALLGNPRINLITTVESPARVLYGSVH